MYRLAAAVAALLALGAPASFAQAGVYSDDLAKCLVKSSSPADQATLVVWVFAAVSAHPAVQPYAKVTDAQRDDVNKQGAKLFERLLTVDCRAETVAALKYEGPSSMESSFRVLGEVAMRSLMSEPKVQASISGLGRDVDQSKIDALAKEAGLSAGDKPADKAK